jgi:ATP-dependent RNA helicase DDX35
MKKRLELKIIVSSATIDAEYFNNYFNTNEKGELDSSFSTIMSIEGRIFPVGW